jgi:putative CocE/NonD family hydrolase
MYTQEWVLLQSAIDPRRRLRAEEPGFADRHQRVALAFHDPAPVHLHLPLSELEPLPREYAEYYYEWLEHPDHDEYWWGLDVVGRYDEIELPAFHLAGWFDRFCLPTLQNYLGLVEAGNASQKLVAGPWPHGIPVQTACDGAFYGPAAYVDARALVLRWYDHWLKGEENGVLDEAPVRLFVQGADEWRDEDAWPPLHARPTPLHLRAPGRLTAEAPGDEQPDSYVYDPMDPVPSTPGKWTRPRGPVDQRLIEERDDVLVYTSRELDGDVEVIGPLSARLWAATDAVDTDWTVKLVDVRPDGYARRVSDGIVRARYRQSQSQPSLLEPGAVYEYVITMLPTAYVFRAGHRLRVEVASASFPACDRNTNSGNRLGADTRGIRATQRIYHDAERPSHVLIPIGEGEAP